MRVPKLKAPVGLEDADLRQYRSVSTDHRLKNGVGRDPIVALVGYARSAGSPAATPNGWRRSNTRRTAIEPSPMAVAIRLTDRLRTSPTPKIPGRLVSSSSGT